MPTRCSEEPLRPDYLSSFFGAAAAGHGLEDLYLFAGTGVLDKVPDVDGAIVAGVGAQALEASVVGLYGIVLLLGRWVRVGCARLSCVHSEPPSSVGRVPGCVSTCGATSMFDAFSLALLYFFRNSFVEFYMIIAYTNIGTENSCCERSTGKMLPAVVHIGDRLRRLRDERYLSQRELADKADVSPATVFKLEANRSEPHPRTIRKLAKALGVEPSELAPKE
jgi:DNA-binding XRE family transcriptional regulator